jgi:glutathione S-transferase
MKLYDCQTAPSPRRVRIFAAEKGIELELIEVDLSAGEQFSDAFRSVNPDCVVPVLELDDGRRITEVIAICQYLEEIQPGPALIGRTPEDRADAIAWTLKIEYQGLLHVRDVLRNSAKGMRGRALTGPQPVAQIPELLERGRQGASAFLARLDRHLENAAFISGDSCTIADITALVFVDFADRLKTEAPGELTHLRRWHGDMRSRESARA